MRILSVLAILALLTFSSKSQGIPTDEKLEPMPEYNLDEVLVLTKKEFASHEDRLEFERLKKNTLKVYPYVEMAVELYHSMNEDLDEVDRRRRKKKYVKEREQEIRDEFETEIRSLTKSQGKILILLINRETGNNCYQIVKDMRSGFTAFWWNVIGKMYGHNLKAKYIPEDNPDLELIVKMIKDED